MPHHLRNGADYGMDINPQPSIFVERKHDSAFLTRLSGAAAASSDCVLTGERADEPTARMNNGEIEQAVERD
jgi:hypothetical protein